MSKTCLLIAISVLVVCVTSAAHAQDISGDWQGTLKGTTASADLRLVLRIKKSDKDGWGAMFYSIDQPPEGLDGVAVSSITLQGRDFKFSIDSLHATYEGKLSPDGNSIKGTWTGRRVLPLEFLRATKENAWHYELPRHTVSFVTVDKDVNLEVLDYGGSGRPIIFLAGLGATAHVFDSFAPKFVSTYHVYGITRRGFGASSAPAPANGNYSADRLGDDVLAVMESLKLDRPVLVGHSIAGEELSSIGSRHPEKIAGLIYLDAGYSYAYYDQSRGDFILDANDLRNKLEQLIAGGAQKTPYELAQEILQVNLPQIEKDLREKQNEMQVRPGSDKPQPPATPIVRAIFEGEQKYSDIRVPILAIFAVPHDQGDAFKDDPSARARLDAWDTARMEALTTAFEKGLPSARVVRLPHAEHFVIESNEPDVLHEMNAFLRSLH
jgi:pimeloyl-ACP methyl ester carboxylesterase